MTTPEDHPMTSREARLDDLEAAFARVPVELVESAADLAESERIRASRHFGFAFERRRPAMIRVQITDQGPDALPTLVIECRDCLTEETVNDEDGGCDLADLACWARDHHCPEGLDGGVPPA